jgi:hypothetical protein
MSCTCKKCDECITGLQAVTVACATQLCEQQLSTDCIIYSGPDNECYGIYNGDTLTNVLDILFTQAFPECSTLTTTTTTSTTTTSTSTTTTSVPCVCYNVGYVGSSYGLSDTFTYLNCARQLNTVTMSSGTNVVVCAIRGSLTFNFYFNNSVAVEVDPYYCGGCTTTTTTTTLNPSQTTSTTTTTTISPSTTTTTTTASPGTTTTTTAAPGTTTTTTTAAPITGLTEAIIILQTGQSNAVGRAGADPANEVVIPLGAYEYKSNTNAVYTLVDPTGISGDNSRATDRSMNPALAKRLIELLGKPVIIVCAAVGNTNIVSWTDPTSTLRATALSRWNAVKAYCTANGITVLGKYIHWLQGENDAAIAMATDAYVENFNNMINLFTTEFAPDKVFATRVGYNDTGTITADSEKIMLAQKQLNFSKDEVIVGTYAPAGFIEGDTAKTGNVVHYTVKGLNIVGQDIATAIHRLRTLNKKPVLTENVTALQDPVGYFDDIYNFRSLKAGSNADLTELFGRNNLTQDSGTTLSFNGLYGLNVGGVNPTSPTTVRELTNTHDWTIEVTFQGTKPAPGMIMNGRSSGNWENDWFWISGVGTLDIRANGVQKSWVISDANYNALNNLVVTYAYATNTLKIYINGALKVTDATFSFTSFKLEKFFRSYQTVPATTTAFEGIVERIRIVKRVLSIWEFDRSPNITTPPAFDYTFNFNGSIAEAAGAISTAYYDHSGIAATPTYDADGIVFPEGGYVRLGAQKTAAKATVEFKVKHDVTATGIEFFCGNRLVADSGGFDSGIGRDGNTMYFGTNGGSPGYVTWTLSGLTYTNFNTYKFVYNGTTVELFVNTVSQGTKSITGNFVLGMIGDKHPTASYAFKGTMDYFKIKNSI